MPLTRSAVLALAVLTVAATPAFAQSAKSAKLCAPKPLGGPWYSCVKNGAVVDKVHVSRVRGANGKVYYRSRRSRVRYLSARLAAFAGCRRTPACSNPPKQ